MRKYFSKPTYVSTKVVEQHEADFPEITVCPDGSDSYKFEALEKFGYGSKKTNYNKLLDPAGNYSWSGGVGSNVSASPELIFKELTYDIWEMIGYVRFHLLNPDDEGHAEVEFSQELVEHQLQYEVQRHRSFGQCYSISPSSDIIDLGVDRIEIK